MFRFAAGFVVGVIAGRPLLNLVNDYLTPPMRRKITNGVNNLADYLNQRIENPEED